MKLPTTHCSTSLHVLNWWRGYLKAQIAKLYILKLHIKRFNLCCYGIQLKVSFRRLMLCTLLLHSKVGTHRLDAPEVLPARPSIPVIKDGSQ